MLTDLSFIAKGKSWPPEDADEKARLSEHQKNRLLYAGNHDTVFPKFSAYIRDQTEDDKKIAIIIGLPKTATRSYIDLLIGESPDIKAPVLYNHPDYAVITDASRLGLGLYEITENGIVAQSPERCYIVTAPEDILNTQFYVFFTEFGKEKQKYVKFTIHGVGFIQHLVYEVKGEKLGDTQPLETFPQYAGLKVDADGKQSTGVNELLIVRIDNVLTSERYYGQSDYTPEVHSKLEALDIAYSDRAEVLRKFTRPKPMAPLSSFTFDHAQQKYIWKSEAAIIIEPDDKEAKYLVWDAQLTSAREQIEDLYKQLLRELSLVAAEEMNKAESGTAIRFKLNDELSRVRWLASAYKQAMAKALSLKSKLDVALGIAGSQEYEPEDVQIQLKDGIPNDQKENAEINNTRATTLAALQAQRIISRKAALRAALEEGIINVPAGMDIEDAILQIWNEAQDDIL